MGTVPLRYLSEAKLIELRDKVSVHRDRYAFGDFLDLEKENGWAIEALSVEVDHGALSTLDGTSSGAATETENSLIVYGALKGMTPAIAREERVWVRLTHIECLAFSRDRWLKGKDNEDLDKAVHLHLFARTLNQTRDDNAIARLWWNAHIATIADPEDPRGALRLILKTADIRSNFVERTGTITRRPLSKAVVRAMRSEPWITSSERAFREFMIALNRNGSGILFEILSPEEVDGFMQTCAARALEKMRKATQKTI